ncbi:hypothetical protein VTK56DRAFT_154 [Thermocarpiscus australiensis]
MALTARLSLTGPDTSEPEDFFGSSLGVIFPDDVTNQHGDSDHGLLYTSPHLPQPLQLALAEVKAESDRHLFSHYLWNASLLLAELIEAGTLGLETPSSTANSNSNSNSRAIAPPTSEFNVAGLSTIELGAGTALPSIMSGLLGARRVVVTDYPAPPILKTLRQNVAGTVQARFAPPGRFAAEEVLVEGHAWGELDDTTPLARDNRHAFDRVFAADCLWMPWQHENLRRSVSWFLSEGESARAWIVAGFHTGREKMRGFFDADALAAVGLEVEHIWERDCDGRDREWVWDRGIEDVGPRKRWLVVGVLRRIRRRAADGKEDS